ncbi:MAG: AAA family ATPase [Bacteroidia bacterium]
MKKINSIKFKNFKAFYGEESLELGGKNLLIYGENGSGKSSIFWGLYTFLQSSTKSLEEVNRYFVHFDAANPDTHNSLKNIFASAGDDAYIELETLDKSTGTKLIDRIDASTTTTTDKAKSNANIALANEASDFINYKLLHNFYNVTHKQEINLWEVFYKDIFPFYRESATQAYYRERIDKLIKGVPQSSGGAKRASGGERERYEDRIQALNLDIGKFLGNIERYTNDFLKAHFFQGKEYLKVALSYPEQISYDKVAWKRHDYRIKMEIELYDTTLQKYIPIKRPHSFLNEALLTRVAIAVRIGALRTRFQESDYQVLCLDDMLISLDMGNREQVVKAFLNTEKKQELAFFDKFQKLIFTHDRAFYNLCKQRIRLSVGDEDWVFKEIYLDTAQQPHRPYIEKSTDYFERATKHLKAFDYPAAANALRQGIENILNEFLPENDKYMLDKTDKTTTGKQLNDLLAQLKKIHEQHKVSLSLIHDLYVYKDHLLNPFSHDNLYSQVYREEIENVLALVPLLKTLKSKMLKEAKDKHSTVKLIDTNAAGEEIVYHIYLRENLRIYTLLDGEKYLSQSEVIVLKEENKTTGQIKDLGNPYKDLITCVKRLAKFLDKSYADEDEMLLKLDIS